MIKTTFKEKLNNYIHKIPDRLLKKDDHKKIVRIYSYIVMAFISFVMTVLNSFTDVGILFYATLIMGIACVFNILLSLISSKGVVISSVLFAIEILSLFTFFIISGNPKGFSIIWLALLPPISMLFYGKKYGIIISAVMFLILIFFLWIPLGHNLLLDEAHSNYSETFCLRFPFLYVGCCLLALILETIQDIAYKSIETKNELLNEMSTHDFLTKIYNRSGALEQIQKIIDGQKEIYLYIGIFDINHFKQINDKYGHFVGDEILKVFASFLKSKERLIPCRWGGDEFAFALASYAREDEFIKGLKDEVSKISIKKFTNDDSRISVSAGVYEAKLENIKNQENVDKMLKKADNILYQVKSSGLSEIRIER